MFDKILKAYRPIRFSMLLRTMMLILGVLIIFFVAGTIVIFLTINATALVLGITPEAARIAVIAGLWFWLFVSVFIVVVLIKKPFSRH